MAKQARDSWDAHWQSYSDSASLNPAQAYRRRLVLGRLRALAEPGARLLDVGCGQGDLLRDLRAAFPASPLAGIEPSLEGRRQALRKAPGTKLVSGDLQVSAKIPAWLKGWAQAAVCTEVLEHLDHPGKLLKNLRPCLSPGAPLLISVPSGPMSAFDRHVGHRRHFNPEDLAPLLEGAGYRVEWIHRAGFPFFNLYRLAVISRGEKLAEEVSAGGDKGLGAVARGAMHAFDLAFGLNLPSSPWGWQLFALARAPQT